MEGLVPSDTQGRPYSAARTAERRRPTDAPAAGLHSDTGDEKETSVMTLAIDHVGINVPETSFEFWQELLRHVGASLDLDGNHFDARIAEGPFLCVTATKEPYAGNGYHRRHTGLSHLALRLPTRELVAALVPDFLQPRGITPLYGGPKEYDYTPGYFALYFEDPSRLKIEVMTSQDKT